ncbi:MAG: FliA/WhiG family RNA polymerase sigma factor [bacterium]|nr:FliA/WhiG family RNA polymerase sigma factor [bacterium]
MTQPLAWDEAVRVPDSAERQRFLESHIDLVRYLATRTAARLPSSVELHDLIHDGIVGLIEAMDKFSVERGVLFRTYAETRIRGAMLDGLRRKDWRPRSVRHMQRNLDAALTQLASGRTRAATEEEIAETMGLEVENYRSLLSDLRSGPLLSLEGLQGSHDPAVGEEDEPHARLEKNDLIRALGEEIAGLPERERRVLELYYHEGLNMKEVGAVLGVTESRVCQLHSQAAGRLRVALEARLHVPPEQTDRLLATVGR